MKKQLLSMVSAIALTAPISALAADGTTETLDEVSVTATRVSTKIKETPATISVLGQEDLDTVKFVDSETELLPRIPGTSMIRNLRIPMGGKNYTANLIDGMAVNTFGAGVQSFANDTNGFDIKRVEVLRGPSSVLYGSNAVGGAINVITRDAPLEPEYRVWGESGMYSRGRGGVSAAGTASGVGYFLDANMLESIGFQDRTENDRKTVSGKLTTDITDNSMLTFRAEYLDVYKENPGSLTAAQFGDDWSKAGVSDAFTDEQMATAIVSYALAPTEQSEMNVNYSIRHHNEAGPPSYSATGDYGEDEVVNQNLTATYRQDFDFLRSRIIGGADIQYSDANEVSFNGRSAAVPLDEDWDITALVTSPFLQLEASPVERLRVTMGARFDKVRYHAEERLAATDENATYTNMSRKIGATWQFDANNSAWVGYGEGFVVPSRTNLFVGSWNYTANNALRPEISRNIEAGVRGRLLNNRLAYDIALYQTHIEDLIVVNDAAGAPRNQKITNAGEARFRGLEVSGAFLATDYLKLAGAYTFARNEFINYVDDGTDYSGNDLESSPEHHVNLRATWMPIDNLDIELEWDKISDYYTDNDNAADTAGKVSRPGLFNLRVSYDYENLSFWAHARNLLDTRYAERVGFSSGARTYNSGEALNVYAGVSYNW